MDAGKRTINDIFNGNRVLEIPFFQRAYVWGDDQWERLLEDMENVSLSNKPYFLGSVILKQQPTNTGNRVGDIRTVIDGQQRLTTINIFFKVLCLKTNQNQTFERIFKLINNEIALLHNHNDIDSFNAVLNLTELSELRGDDNIILAYHYFKKHIEPEKLNFNNILSKILFVGIDLDENEDEQQIFDTINSLGVKLTTAELLKNYFFNRDEISAYEKYWKKIFERDEDTKNYWDREITTGRSKRTFIDLFFFSYLQIKIQEKGLSVKADDKHEYSKVDQLFESYKAFIKVYLGNDKKLILEEIKEYVLLFETNFKYDIIENELTPNYGVERINAIIFGLETSTLIPYVLYVLKNVADEITRNNLFAFLECYVMRRMVVHANTKDYNQLFTDRLINNEILTRELFIEFLETRSDKVNYLPSDDELKNGFNNGILINKQSAGILYFIESKIRNRDMQSTQILGISKYSLEHLMPKKWENHWGKLANQEDRVNRNRKLLTLGNLTIITQALNSTIRDSNWAIKKNGKGDKKGLLQYSAGLETISHQLQIEEWNEQTIGQRADELFKHAKEIWRVENTQAIRGENTSSIVTNKVRELTKKEDVIRMADKTADELSSQERQKSGDHLRIEFWNSLLPLLKDKTTIFQKSKATKANSIWAGGTGIGSIGYAFIITNNFVSVAFGMCKPDKVDNKEIFDELKKYQTEIESNFGHKLKWERQDDTIRSMVSYSLDNMNIFNRDEWDRILDFLSKNMIKFEEALREPLLNVKKIFEMTKNK